MPIHLLRLFFVLILVSIYSTAWAQEEDDPSDLPGYSGEIEDEDEDEEEDEDEDEDEEEDEDDPDNQVDPEPGEGDEDGKKKNEIVEDPEAIHNLMKEVLTVYLKMHKYLAEDSTWRVKRSGGLIALKVKNFDIRKIPKDQSPLYRDIPNQLRKAARNIYKHTDLASQRRYFRALSRPLATWANIANPVGVDVLYCPVYNGTWLQLKGPTKNPYYGTQMLTSGQVVHAGPAIPTAEPEKKDGDKKQKPKAADIDELMKD